MGYLLCPKCKIRRFQVKDKSGNSRVVIVNSDRRIELVHHEETLDGFNIDNLHCLGCSWTGPASKLVKY